MKQTLLLLIVLVSFSSYSQNEYKKLIYESQSQVYGNELVQTDDNGILIAGSINFSGAAISVDSAGNVNWAKSYHGDFNFQEAIATSDSAFLLAGRGPNADLQHNTAHLIKLNTNGDTIWTKNFDLGNSQYCDRVSICETFDSNYVMALSENTARFGIVKLDQNGNILWSKSLENNLAVATINSIDELSDSSILVSGYSYGFGHTGFLMKLSPTGQIIWTKHFEELLINNLITIDSGFIAVGKGDLLGFEYVLTVFKFNNDGINEWSKKINGAHTGSLETSPDIAWVSDSTFLVSSESDWDTYVVLFNEDGTASNSFNISMYGQDFMILNDKSALFMGNGPILGIKTQFYEPHIGLVRTDTLISIPECSYMISVNTDSLGVAPDSVITFPEIGTLSEYVSDITISTPPLQVANECVPIYGSIDEINSSLPVTVYPNSSSGIFNFEVTTIGGFTLSVIDSKGREIEQYESNQSFKWIDLSSEADGLYYYKIVDDSGRQAYGKLILMK